MPEVSSAPTSPREWAKDSEIALEMPIENWGDPINPDSQAAALAALESGRLIVFPRLSFALEEPELGLLSPGTLNDTRKNISFDPTTGIAHGTALAGEDVARLIGMLDRFGRQADTLLRALIPRYAAALERARTSFRPAEIAGRAATPRNDDTRLHVDAFPSRPMRGRRILRVFSNISTDGTPRVWRVGEPFPDFATKFLPRIRTGIPGQGWIMERIGLTKGRRSAYDFAMLGLHDACKIDTSYQATAPATELRFQPGTTWMCFTDSVLHAALAGRCALEQTFHIPIDAMANPGNAPLRVLEAQLGRPLVPAH